jgi:hypothetical protein
MKATRHASLLPHIYSLLFLRLLATAVHVFLQHLNERVAAVSCHCGTQRACRGCSIQIINDDRTVFGMTSHWLLTLTSTMYVFDLQH